MGNRYYLFFNKAIKNKIVTGFEKINEREILINTDNIEYIEQNLINKARTKNIVIKITEV